MNIKYRNRIVTFIDVLGFKNLVYADSNTAINKYYEFVLNNFAVAAKEKEIDYLLISDSILIYSEEDRGGFETMVKTINILQAGLLARGILIRGAISFGKLYINKSKNIVVGTGLINAYKLELNALYPRVIIDRSIVNKFYNGFDDLYDKNTVNGISHILIEPPMPYKIDYPYLNYGRLFSTRLHNKPFENVIALFQRDFYKNEHISKFEWLREHIVQALGDQFIFLENKETLNSNERKRLRKLRDFQDVFSKM